MLGFFVVDGLRPLEANLNGHLLAQLEIRRLKK